jgi:hypothetical protein
MESIQSLRQCVIDLKECEERLSNFPQRGQFEEEPIIRGSESNPLYEGESREIVLRDSFVNEVLLDSELFDSC